jgi:hypothetical protein
MLASWAEFSAIIRIELLEVKPPFASFKLPFDLDSFPISEWLLVFRFVLRLLASNACLLTAPTLFRTQAVIYQLCHVQQ